MDVYLTKEVKIWATKAGVTDGMFRDAADEVARGLFEANHGSGLLKKRVASNTGRGKSGGARTGDREEGGAEALPIYGKGLQQSDQRAD